MSPTTSNDQSVVIPVESPRRALAGDHLRMLDGRRSRSEAEHDQATAAQRDWMDEHRPDAQRYLALDHEQRLRTGAELAAHERIEALRRGIDPIEHVRELPTRELDHGLDLGP